MKLTSADAWCDLLDRLRERGAVQVEIGTHADGSIAHLRATLQPPRVAPPAPAPKPKDEGPRPKSRPAGLGYT